MWPIFGKNIRIFGKNDLFPKVRSRDTIVSKFGKAGSRSSKTLSFRLEEFEVWKSRVYSVVATSEGRVKGE